MKDKQQIEVMLDSLRSGIKKSLCMGCDKVLMARIGTILWVLDRENEPLETPLNQTDEDVLRDLGVKIVK